MITQTPFLGGSYISRTRLLNCQRLVNLYPEMVETHDGKEVGAFYGTPGLSLVFSATDGGEWRELHEMGNGALYGVVGNRFIQFSGTFNATVLGHVQTDSGHLQMADNGTQILIVDGVNAYGYDIPSNHFSAITLPFVGAPTCCTYQDGFFLMNQAGTQKFWQSNLLDVFTWDGLNFSSKDGQPDPIATILSSHRELWVIGTLTTEVWINAGNSGFSFQRLQGVFIEYGCVARASAQEAGNSIIWLSQSKDGQCIVVQNRGYVPQRISTHAIEREFSTYGRVDNAMAYTYEQEGHLFYMLIFPTADKTWCYDLSTGLWHERASFDNGHFVRHRSNCHAVFKGKHIVGDFENGNLYEFDLDEYTDNGAPKKWLRSWPAQGTGKLTLLKNRYNNLQLYMEPGVGAPSIDRVRSLQKTDFVRTLDDKNFVRVISGPPPAPQEGDINPQVMLRFSDDGGLSWSNEYWRPVGKIGETKHRVRWTRLGSGRDRVFEVSATDPFKTALVGAIVDVEPGIS